MASANIQMKETTNSKVFNALRALTTPSSISQISSFVPELSEMTVRRAVKSMMKSGFIIEAGRASGSSAILYALADASSTGEGKLIPHAGGFVSVEDFMRIMSSTSADPFKSLLKTEVLSEEIKTLLRRRMLFAVIFSGDPGLKTQTLSIQTALFKIQSELERLLTLVSNFNNSAIWYDHYRDQIAFGVREAQQADPELFQLCRDYIK